MPLPDIATVDRQSSPNEWPVLHLQQHTENSTDLTLREGCDGAPVDLTGAFKVQFVTKDHLTNQEIYTDTEVTVVTAVDGEINLAIPADELFHPGVFYGEFALYAEDPDNPGEASPNPYKRLPAYVEVTQSLTTKRPITNYGLRICEVRMAMWDRCPEDNFLLDAVMFSDAQIAFAIQRPVDYYNEIPPNLGITYSAADFPYRYHWTNATIGELYTMAAMNYVRNSLTYQAHGVTVADKDKFQQYAMIGKEMKQEYKDYIDREKRNANAMAAMGSCGNQYYG